jgi:hypothetical protein
LPFRKVTFGTLGSFYSLLDKGITTADLSGLSLTVLAYVGLSLTHLEDNLQNVRNVVVLVALVYDCLYQVLPILLQIHLLQKVPA